MLESIVLKKVPSAKLRRLAVVPRNEQPMLRVALSPKIIPLGLSKNKLAVPLALSTPSMLETDRPVTRLIGTTQNIKNPSCYRFQFLLGELVFGELGNL